VFKDFIMEERLNSKLSIRSFCKLSSEDPSNWSKIERGLMDPPTDEKRLKKIAEVLNINLDSDKYKKLYDLAFVSVGQIPEYITDDKELLEELPAFFRTIDNVKPTAEELRSLIEELRKR
jgi:transcriptional regulator with XRE-family HTH domain